MTTQRIDLGARERHARLVGAFHDAAIASSHMLHAVLTTVYRLAPDDLAHVHRVSHTATLLGRLLGLPDADTAHLGRAALVHDLGKLVVGGPPPAFDWPAGTVPPAWRAQVEVAAGLAAQVPFLSGAAPLVRASQECFDGTGYPHGLSGGAIPVGARILHFADMRDALDGFCRAAALGPELVETELLRLAGSRFDPRVVDAWRRWTAASALTDQPLAGHV